MPSHDSKSAKVAMLIRKPAAEVFEAFADPAVTTRFWFTKGSGRLEPGARVRWDWEMYGHSVDVAVLAVEPGRRILVEWPGAERPATVEWTFTAREDGGTFVEIAADLSAEGDALLAEAIGTTEGFALVLAGAKALLEHGIELGLVADRFPDGLPSG